jgi:hypothetical protein
MSTLRFVAALAALGLGLALAVQAHSMLWTSAASAAREAVHDFAEAIAQHRERQGHLPGDINHDGEIDTVESAYVALHLARTGLIRAGATEVSASVAGRRVTLRAISRHASMVRGFGWDIRNVVELRGLPCNVAQELDARNDDGNFATGNIQAAGTSCAIGGFNDPVPVVAVALRP